MPNRRIISALALFSTIAALLLIYSRAEQIRPAMPIGKPLAIAPPRGLPPVPVPADNPLTVETVASASGFTLTRRCLSTNRSRVQPATNPTKALPTLGLCRQELEVRKGRAIRQPS